MTTTGTLTITDFLLARIAEDEKMANAALGCHAYAQDYPTRAVMYSASGDALFEFDERQMREADRSTLALAEHFCSWQPARVLAECKAKRAIVEWHTPMAMSGTAMAKGYLPNCQGCYEDGGLDGAPSYPCRNVRHLAAVYASHPDYDPEWADMTYR